MPVSKKRKKKGKKVGNGQARLRQQTNQRLERFADQPSAVSLQDLINVVAYQEKHGTFPLMGADAPSWAKPEDVVATGAEFNIPEIVPVTIGEGDDKREVGTASPIPGDEEHLSVNITDEEVLNDLLGQGNYSIVDKEKF